MGGVVNINALEREIPLPKPSIWTLALKSLLLLLFFSLAYFFIDLLFPTRGFNFNGNDGVLLCLISLYMSIVSVVVFNPFGVRFNFATSTRRAMIANIISKTEGSLVIYSGCFHSRIYKDKNVMLALNSLPKDVEIKLYRHENKTDNSSTEFMKFIKTRKLKIEDWPVNDRRKL